MKRWAWWALIIGGGGLWVFDVVRRLRDANDPAPLLRVLAITLLAGAALQGLFLLFWTWLMQHKRNGGLARNYGNWTGATLALTMLLLSLLAYVFDRLDPLVPIAFFIGFVLTLFGTHGRLDDVGLSHTEGDDF